ncbi:MAG TPA: hypothetical protein VKA70_18245 [Blastocatellia bacterium]|nr:hypothetical protein [Blastocatellia bacterium]
MQYKLKRPEAISYKSYMTGTRLPVIVLILGLQEDPAPSWLDRLIAWGSENPVTAVLSILLILALSFATYWLWCELRARRWIEEHHQKATSPSTPYPTYDYNYATPLPDSGSGNIRVYKDKRSIWSKLRQLLTGGRNQIDESEFRQQLEKQRRIIEEVRGQVRVPDIVTRASPEPVAKKTNNETKASPVERQPGYTLTQPDKAAVASKAQKADVPTEAPRPVYAPSRDGGSPAIKKVLAGAGEQPSASKLRPAGRELPANSEDHIMNMIKHYVNWRNERVRHELLDEVHRELEQLRTSLDVEKLQLVSDAAKQFNQQGDKLTKQNRVIESALDHLEMQNASLHRALSDKLEKQEKWVQEQLAEIKAELHSESERRDENDAFYARLLGSIFGQNVEALQEEPFRALTEEAADLLNRFFQEEMPRVEALVPLVKRAESIRASMKLALEAAAALNPEASLEMQLFVEQANNLVSSLVAMQAQLQSRHLRVESNISIPVSGYKGARYTFLEQLGMSIKREIDKFRDPHAYFSAEIERLATRDVIALADLCDGRVAKPAYNGSLEAALGDLFVNSGLKCILPTPKEAFNPLEQNIGGMISGSPDEKQRIARVESRGFVYVNGNREKLIRKARVDIYR